MVFFGVSKMVMVVLCLSLALHTLLGGYGGNASVFDGLVDRRVGLNSAAGYPLGPNLFSDSLPTLCFLVSKGGEIPHSPRMTGVAAVTLTGFTLALQAVPGSALRVEFGSRFGFLAFPAALGYNNISHDSYLRQGRGLVGPDGCTHIPSALFFI
jgi:hypothetical protein